MPVKTDLRRFEKKIMEYETYPIIKNKIILYGSSFFTNWGYERAQKQLSNIGGEELAVVNHGFGGSTGDEQLYYYPRMIAPFEPKMIVLRGCVNDLSRGYTPDEAFEASMRLYAFAKTDFPELKFVVLQPFEYRSAVNNPNIVKGMAHYINRMKEIAPDTPDLHLIDFSPLLYKSPEYAGTYTNYREDIFLEDGLHFNDFAYETLFTPFFKTELERIENI